MTDLELLDVLYKEKIDISKLPELLVEKLKEKKMKIATAESCTGGMISEKIVSVDGASKVFDMGICAYGNNIKRDILKISEEVIDEFGAVSEECSLLMAENVRKLSRADIGISTTGIAGPTGGTIDKPVGTVFVSVSTEDSSSCTKMLLNDSKLNDREKIRELSCAAAIYLALKKLN